MFSISNIELLTIILLIISVKGNDVTDAFSEAGIVPDIIPNAPTNEAEVVFQDDSTIVEINLGNVITATQAKNQPNVTWNANENSFYCVMMTGTNPIPSRTKQFLHWLLVNIPGEDLASGENISRYIGPIPLPKFRYIIFIFEQPGEINFDAFIDRFNNVLARLNFSVEDFANEFNFGTPVSGNFFFSETTLSDIGTDLENVISLLLMT